jgi:hypothetical protein
MSTLGKNGRFANQIFQYFFLKIVEYALEIEIRYPRWNGEFLFKIPHSPNGVQVNSSLFEEGYPNFAAGSTPDYEINKIRNLLSQNSEMPIDIIGFFQFHTGLLQKYKDLFKGIYRFNDAISSMVSPKFDKLKSSSEKIIGIHVRRGDYLIEQESSPLFWCHDLSLIVSTIKERSEIYSSGSIFYLASDEALSVSQELNSLGIECIRADDLFNDLSDAGRMAVDFYFLAKADSLLISNSSFSFAASMLNANADIFLRPEPKSLTFVAYDPWNSFTLLAKDKTFY